MKKINHILLLFVAMFITTSAFAQINPIKQYTEDPLKFLEEIKATFEVTNMGKKELKEYMETFTLAWNSPKYNEKLKKATYATCNMMIKKKIRILPEYQDYLTSVMNFINSKQSEDNFMSWQECINKILSGKSTKYFSDYLQMSENLFNSNTFYKSAVVSYSSNNNNYMFEYDSVPVVIFPSLNLRCHNNQNDSGIVYNTKGSYYPYTGVFVGQGGKVNWTRAGFDENTVYAELKNYQIVLKTSGFSADSVTFYNTNYFQKSLKGRLTEKVVSERGTNISYPRFESYDKRMKIPDIAQNVDYDGGFSMRGPKFIGAGSKDEDALLIFRRNDKKFLVVASKSIGVTKDKLSSEDAKIKFYFDNDSVTHPSIDMKFITATRQLSLIRTSSGIAKSPYINTFHKIDMYFEELVWKIDEPTINLKMLAGNSQEDAMFESNSYFRNDRYDRLQGLDAIHPLVRLRDFIKKNNNERDFYGDEYARFIKIAPNEVRPVFITLAAQGLLTYNPEEDKVHINDKLLDYIAHRAKKLDYDVIQFPSVVRGSLNASINLLNYDMTIYGVKQVFMSDSQNVTIYPAEQKILLKKNRDFVFAGVVHAGRFDFFGKEFSFDYNKFIIDLKNVDSLRLTVKSREPNAYGEYPLVRVKTVIEHINGNLEIDEPGNKSGLKSYPKYPIFNSFKDSYAYYNKKEIQNGRYPKDKFYFHLDPFTIDSLDNFSNEGLNFKGEMVTADIFPVFREALRLQPDYSLGFVTQAPEAGYPLYGGKGKYNATIKLSHKGLKGAGSISYVTSVTKSDDFTFYPDSTNAIAQTFDIKEQATPPEFPAVHGEDVKIHWVPSKDIMQAWNSKEKRFAAYESYKAKSEIDGELDLTPKELTGKGAVDFNSAKLDSRLITFKSSSFDSDTANFALKDPTTGDLAFATYNVKANLDFKKRMGEFKSNGAGSVVQFPANQYICFMESFKWYMDDANIEIGGSEKTAKATKDDLDLEGPEFISVHPKQDSLRFHASSGKYDLKKLVISAKGVTYINLADARVYPENGDVVIDKNASMRPLTNSKIVANSVTKYHNLYNCTVNAIARKNYTGSGYYDYIDETKAKKTFYFSDIGVDTTYQTFAETEIKDTSNFTLSPNFEYKGKVKLKAAKTFLVFDGAARIVHTCPSVPHTWFSFESEVDPNSIYIPIGKQPTDAAGRPIAASLMVTTDSTHFYSAFLSPRKSTNDTYVLPAEGFLFFDKASREYRISNKEKLVERSLPGNYLSLNVGECKTYGEGKVNLGGDFGQVKIESFGTVTHALIKDSTIFDMVMSMDFFFDDGAISKMGEAINNDSHLKPADIARPVFEKGLREMLGKEAADKLISQLNLYGSFKKFPDELKKTIFFNDVKMKWNKETRSYTSVGQIGIGNLNKDQINRLVDGKIEIVKKRGGDILNIYLELDPTNWYYFNYTRGTMLAVSSNEAFNTILKELKQDKRKKAGAKGEPDYYYNVCPPNKKTAFLRKTSKDDKETESED